MKKLFSLIVALLMVFTGFNSTVKAAEPLDLTGTYDVVVNGYDWGPSVSKVILKLNNTVTEIAQDSITVKESKMWYSNAVETFDRQVTKAYKSDESGTEVTTDSKYVTLDLKVSPNDGSPFIYKGLNNWTKPYYLTFTLNNTLKLVNGNATSLTIEQEYVKRIMPEADKFEYKKYIANADNQTYSYASYTPKKDSKKNPLIIWLNGGGEGGTDATIAVLGNRVSKLIDTKTQNAMNGAYVLVPQAPTAWMRGYNTKTGGDSIYTAGLMELIKNYVNNHEDIDVNRIYIGGCSNGGYMTLQMVTKYPGYFAAAFPICTGYSSATMSDENLKKIKDLPLWFLYADNDTTLAPDTFSKPIIERLKAMKATNLHVSSTPKVVDTSGLYKTADGQPYEYNGHWSWVYAFNNESFDNEDKSLELFTWLAKQNNEANVLNGTYDIVVDGYDWGPSVSKAIINLKEPVTSVDATTFKVTETKNWYSKKLETFDREVTKAYLSDENGKTVTTPSKYVTVELKVSPNDGSPFYYEGVNNWVKPYYLTITLNDGKTLTTEKRDYAKVEIATGYIQKIIPEASKFTHHTYVAKVDGTKYSYASYTPEKDNKKNPLIIWLHGGGEGGTDPFVVTLGNKATALTGDKIQKTMGGAYVLAPQAKTMWMDGYFKVTNGQFAPSGGSSIYTKSLSELIKEYVKNNDDIDVNRIYIGGCSNGGYMTIEMLINNPDLFAAAYPICPGFLGTSMTSEAVNKIKDIPMWFLYAKNDTTLVPNQYAVPVIEKLRAAKAKDIRVSSPDKVVDTSGLYKTVDGSPYEYAGHWSWIYAFNSESFDDNDKNTELFAWLAKQVKTAPSVIEVAQPKLLNGAKQTYVKGSNKGIEVRTSAEVKEFIKVLVDGKEISKENYEVRSGSTIVTLKPSYLETLSYGVHTLTVVSTSGSVTTTFEVKAPAKADKKNVKTGDETNLMASVLALGAALTLIIGLNKKRKFN